jgi:hypothetical protein
VYGKRCDNDGNVVNVADALLFDDNTTLLLLDELTIPIKNDLRHVANEYASKCPREVG